MNLSKASKFLKKQSPLILSIIGAAGVVATTVMAVNATPKALATLKYEYKQEPERDAPMSNLDVVRATWKCYIPAIAVGTATIACIFGANALNKQQQATLMGAYMFLDRSYKEYKHKVAELYEDGDRKVREEIAKDKYTPSNRLPGEELPYDSETLLFYEEHYGRFFERKMIEVLDAEYQLNRKFVTEGEANLNDFFELLGLPTTKEGEELGWSLEAGAAFYSYSWIDFEHELTKMEDGMECYIINTPVAPTLGYSIPF